MSKSIKVGGASFLDLLLILFIGLKLTNQIDWSWYAVFAPLWIPLTIALFFFSLAIIAKGFGK